jgi:hypothetical protein
MDGSGVGRKGSEAEFEPGKSHLILSKQLYPCGKGPRLRPRFVHRKIADNKRFGTLWLSVYVGQAYWHGVFLTSIFAPLRDPGFVHPPVNRADFGVFIFRPNRFGDSLPAEQGNLMRGFGHRKDLRVVAQHKCDDMMRNVFKSNRLAAFHKTSV